MHRRRFITIAGIGTVAALAGCTTAADEEPTNVEELHVEQVDRNTIRVSGVGSVETEPDKATFTVAVESTHRDDASAVVEDLAEKAETLRTALLDYGIPEDNITTSGYSLREHSRNNQYEGRHEYLVELDDPDVVGEVIDVCADAGADSIGRIDFTVSEERRDELYEDAIQGAVDDARNEAELYTTAADQTLGEPVSIETTRTGHSPFRQRYDLAVAEATEDGAETQIEQGDVAVTAEVTIEYEFES